MSRSPMRLGSPAFGWIASGRLPAAGTICSSTPYKVLEPTEQFAPRAWTPSARNVRPTSAVDLPHLALEPVRRELEAVGAKGVGLDQVGPRRDVLGVDRLHEPRVVQVEDVEARVERHPARVEHRAHRAVAEERPGVQTLAKRARHGFP